MLCLHFLKMDGKLGFSIESLKFETRTLANISAFFLTIFIGISVSWEALEVSNFRMSLRISSLGIFEKEKGSLWFLLWTSPIASMLGWFLYFTIHFKTGSLTLLAKGSLFENPSILRLLTILEKKVFKTSTVLSSHIVVSSSLVVIHNNCAVFSTSFCFLQFYPLKNCFKVSFLSLFP